MDLVSSNWIHLMECLALDMLASSAVSFQRDLLFPAILKNFVTLFHPQQLGDKNKVLFWHSFLALLAPLTHFTMVRLTAFNTSIKFKNIFWHIFRNIFWHVKKMYAYSGIFRYLCWCTLGLGESSKETITMQLQKKIFNSTLNISSSTPSPNDNPTVTTKKKKKIRHHFSAWQDWKAIPFKWRKMWKKTYVSSYFSKVVSIKSLVFHQRCKKQSQIRRMCH